MLSESWRSSNSAMPDFRRSTPRRVSAWRHCWARLVSSSQRDTDEARALEARLRFAAGELDIAEKLAQRALKQDHEDIRSLNLMALIAVRRGEANNGIGFLRRALRVRPFDPEATELLAQLEESAQ